VFPSDLEAHEVEAGYSQLWHRSGECPQGTVAIRRTMLRDVLRAGGFQGYQRKKDGLASVPQPSRPQSMSNNGHEVSITESRQVLLSICAKKKKKSRQVQLASSESEGFFKLKANWGWWEKCSMPSATCKGRCTTEPRAP
jgi:hypothetical protein